MLAPYIPEPSPWTAEKTNLFLQLWAAGDTASEIARLLGPEFTRNGVLGKRYRMGLNERPRAGGKPAAERKRKLWDQLTPEQKAERGRRNRIGTRQRLSGPPLPIYDLPPEPKSIANSRPCSLMELTANTCRWPVGDVGQPGFHFCGAESDGTYCEYHHRIAYQKPNYGPRKPWVEWRVRS